MYRTRTLERQNRLKVVETVDLQALGATTVIYGEIDSESMRDFNPSICWHKGELWITLRRCNFGVQREGKWFFRDQSAYSRTIVMLGKMNPDTLQVSDLAELKLSDNSPIQILTAGLEDVRLFSRKDGMHAIGFVSDRLTRSLHNSSASLAEYLIKGNRLVYLRTLKKPHKETVEKNWAPTDIPNDIFDFAYSDTQSWKDGKLIGRPSTSNIHGGSQLIHQKDGTYISLVHEKKLDPKFRHSSFHIYDRYIYHTYLARHNRQGIITHITKPFTFGTHENIEFAAGMVEDEDNFLISVGVHDCKYAIAKIKKQTLVDMLKVVE